MSWLLPALRVFATAVTNAPDGVRSVVGDQQRSVLSHGDADRPSPDVPVVEHKAGQEILVLTARPVCLVHRHADHFISTAYGSIPRTMLRGENVASIFRRELSAFIKRHRELSIVRLQKHVGNNCLVFQLRMLAFVRRVLMSNDGPPGQAI